MSTDRELLEQAAKAAGLTGGKWQDWPGMEFRYGLSCSIWHEETGHWNPLEDDGDALRLAVKLRIDLHTSPINGEAVIVTAKRRMRSDLLRQPNPTMAAEDCASDPYAATRRAIVRAAAEIGRATQGAAPATGETNAR